MINCRHPRLLITALVWSLMPSSVETKLLAKDERRFVRVQFIDEYPPRRSRRTTPVIGIGDKLPDRSCIVGGRQVTLRRVKCTGGRVNCHLCRQRKTRRFDNGALGASRRVLLNKHSCMPVLHDAGYRTFCPARAPLYILK